MLKPEYQKIVNEASHEIIRTARNDGYLVMLNNKVINQIALRFQDLADKPAKHLSDEQLMDAWENNGSTIIEAARAILDAHIKLQQEPEEVAFDPVEFLKGGWETIREDGCWCSGWLHVGMTYKRMRRKL